MDWAWAEVAVPRGPARPAGARMAGFRLRAPVPVDLTMVAHPSVTLLLDLGDEPELVCRTPAGPTRGSVVAGLLPGELHTTGRHGECLQIRLSPVLAGPVLGAAVSLRGTVAPLTGRWVRDLEDRLRATRSWDERFTIAGDALGRRITDRPPVAPEVAHAWRRTVAARGRLRVDDLAGEVGWSRTRLWSRFRAQLGIGPKHAARLVRFDRAAHLLAAGRPAAWVAAEGGYTDQSHLHREVRDLSGLTPAAVAAADWLAVDDVAWPSPAPSRPIHPIP